MMHKNIMNIEHCHKKLLVGEAIDTVKLKSIMLYVMIFWIYRGVMVGLSDNSCIYRRVIFTLIPLYLQKCNM